MAGTIDTQEIQAGQEGTWGTVVPGTARLMGITECVFQPVKPTKVIRQLHGSLGAGNLGVRMMGYGKGTVKGVVTYEDINYWLEGVFGIVTPSGGGPYIRAGAAPLATAAINPRIMSLIKGDVDGVYTMIGGMVDDLNISVKQSEGDAEMMFDANLLGKDIVTGTLASLADRALNVVSANDVSIWIDAAGTALGTTAVASTAWGVDFKFSAGRKIKPYLGLATPGGIASPGFDASKNTCKLSFELNATSKAFLDSIIGASTWQRNVRVKATQGANILQIDMGVQAKDSPSIVTDNNGVKSVVVDCIALETVGLGNFLKYSSTVTLPAVLP